jgi:Pre-toxin TG
VSAPDFELPLVELPFAVQPLDTPPPTQEELDAEYYKLRREQDEAERELQSVFLNLLPGVGSVKGLVEAFADEDLVTGRNLAWWEQALNVVSALPLIHEAATVVKLVGHGGTLAKVAHGAHRVHQFNKVVHAYHAGHPIEVIVMEPARQRMEDLRPSGGEN